MSHKIWRIIGFFWGYLRKYRLSVWLSMTTLAIHVGIGLFSPYLYKLFFDVLAKGLSFDPHGKKLVELIVVIALFHIIRTVFRRVGDFIYFPLSVKVMNNMAMDTFDGLHHHSYSFFTNQFSGSLVKRANRLISAFEAISEKSYYYLAPLVLNLCITFAVLMILHPSLGLAMVVWTILFLFFSIKFALYKWKFDLERSEADTKISANLSDTVVNNINLKLFFSLPYEKIRHKILLSDWGKKMNRSWKLGRMSDIVQSISMIALEFVIFYFAIGLWTKDQLTVGDFVWIQTYLLQIFMGLWEVGRTIRELSSRMADADEMIEILDTPHEIQDAPKAKSLRVTDGKIDFKHISFTYKKGEPVIRDFDLSIKPGEKVALIGPSGGGKSTITKLLLRFFDPQKGNILIDGQDIRKVSQDSLRSHIGYVPQDPILFHRPLMENIRYGNLKASDKAVIAAAKMAHCHEFIQQFPEQYNTYVGERGVKLSGGERQRVAIARAILANTPILILDEATSSLDSESESLIQQALENLIQQKTCLVIAHRLSTIMKMDRIIVLQAGQIVEQGTHADLLSKNASLYKRLWDLQVGGYLSMTNL